MRKITCTFLVVLAIIAGISSTTYGYDTFLEDFNRKYLTEGTRLNTCITCHVTSNPQPDGDLNAYGLDFRAYGLDFDAFGLIEHRDSDRDGFSNLAEIESRTFPGDPTDVPDEDSACFIDAATFGFHHFSHGLTSLYQCLRSTLFFFGLGELHEGPAL